MKQHLISFLKEKNYIFEAIVREFREVEDLLGIHQNPEYHAEGDAYIHTERVCKTLTGLEEWKELSEEEKGILYMAALFHDIGKRSCTRVEEGVIRSPRHTIAGAKIFRELCYKKYEQRLLLEFPVREEIAFLIRLHGLPPLFMEKKEISRSLIKASECVRIRLLYLLSKADVLGRESRGTKNMLSAVEYFKEYSEELGCYNGRITFANRYTRFRYLSGARVRYEDALYDDTEFPVYMMAGLPLSGKDTFVVEHFKELPVVSLDDIREEWKIGPEAGSGRVASEARERAKVYLRKKQSFVWNATNICTDTRKKLCSLFEAYGARVAILYVETPYEELLRRNLIRQRSVPVPVINTMIRKMDMVEPYEAYSVEYLHGNRRLEASDLHF